MNRSFSTQSFIIAFQVLALSALGCGAKTAGNRNGQQVSAITASQASQSSADPNVEIIVAIDSASTKLGLSSDGSKAVRSKVQSALTSADLAVKLTGADGGQSAQRGNAAAAAISAAAESLADQGLIPVTMAFVQLASDALALTVEKQLAIFDVIFPKDSPQRAAALWGANSAELAKFGLSSQTFDLSNNPFLSKFCSLHRSGLGLSGGADETASDDTNHLSPASVVQGGPLRDGLPKTNTSMPMSLPGPNGTGSIPGTNEAYKNPAPTAVTQHSSRLQEVASNCM